MERMMRHWAGHFQKTIHGYLRGREMNEAISGWKRKAAIQVKAGLKTKKTGASIQLDKGELDYQWYDEGVKTETRKAIVYIDPLIGTITSCIRLGRLKSSSTISLCRSA
jgi:hypothetical protein